jgi:hypothetical protein
VSVLLVCLSGYLHYPAPRHRVQSQEEQVRAIAEPIVLAALRRQARRAQAEGAIGHVREALQSVRA